MSDNATISALAEFVYPHLNKPDVRFNEAGEYKVNLKVPQKQALEMVTLIDKKLDEAIAVTIVLLTFSCHITHITRKRM